MAYTEGKLYDHFENVTKEVTKKGLTLNDRKLNACLSLRGIVQDPSYKLVLSKSSKYKKIV